MATDELTNRQAIIAECKKLRDECSEPDRIAFRRCEKYYFERDYYYYATDEDIEKSCSDYGAMVTMRRCIGTIYESDKCCHLRMASQSSGYKLANPVTEEEILNIG